MAFLIGRRDFEGSQGGRREVTGRLQVGHRRGHREITARSQGIKWSQEHLGEGLIYTYLTFVATQLNM